MAHRTNLLVKNRLKNYMRRDLTYARLDSTSQNMENSENSEKLRNLKFYESFRVFLCLVQSKVKMIILVKTSLRKVRFNSCKATLREVMSHQCHYSLLNISVFDLPPDSTPYQQDTICVVKSFKKS